MMIEKQGKAWDYQTKLAIEDSVQKGVTFEPFAKPLI